MTGARARVRVRVTVRVRVRVRVRVTVRVRVRVTRRRDTYRGACLRSLQEVYLSTGWSSGPQSFDGSMNPSAMDLRAHPALLTDLLLKNDKNTFP